MTMRIELSPQIEEFVHEQLASGQYASVSEVILQALLLLAEQTRQNNLRLAPLREKIEEGLASGPGISWDPDAIKVEGRALLAGHTGH